MGNNRRPDGVRSTIQPIPKTLKDYKKKQERIIESKKRKKLYERIDKLESSSEPDEVALAKRLRKLLNSCTPLPIRYKGRELFTP